MHGVEEGQEQREDKEGKGEMIRLKSRRNAKGRM